MLIVIHDVGLPIDYNAIFEDVERIHGCFDKLRGDISKDPAVKEWKNAEKMDKDVPPGERDHP